MNYPGLRTSIGSGKLVVSGMLQPTAMSREYRITIEYRYLHHPSVFVPALTCNGKGEPPPHRYPSVGRPLCLYYPKDGEWTPFDYLADTIVPWTAEYLLFYELWLATDIWYGGGVDHGEPKGHAGAVSNSKP